MLGSWLLLDCMYFDKYIMPMKAKSGNLLEDLSGLTNMSIVKNSIVK